MHGERMPSSTNKNESLSDTGEINELPRETAQKLGKEALRTAFIDAKPPVSQAEGRINNETSFDPSKKERLNSILRDQAEAIAKADGQDLNSVILDQAERAPDLYSNEELVNARTEKSFNDIFTLLSSNNQSGQNDQLLRAVHTALEDLKSSGALNNLKYDTNNKQISSPDSLVPLSSSISFSDLVPANQLSETPSKKEKLNSILREQAKTIAEVNDQDLNSVILDQAERAPDLYSNAELVAARMIKSFDDVLSALSAGGGQSHQLVEVMRATFNNFSTPSVLSSFSYNPKTKQIIHSATERPSTPGANKIIDFSGHSRTTESPTFEEAA